MDKHALGLSSVQFQTVIHHPETGSIKTGLKSRRDLVDISTTDKDGSIISIEHCR